MSPTDKQISTALSATTSQVNVEGPSQLSSEDKDIATVAQDAFAQIEQAMQDDLNLDATAIPETHLQRNKSMTLWVT